MKKRYWAISVVALLIISIGGCYINSKQKEERLIQKVIPIGTQYIKDNFDVEVTFNRHQGIGGYVNSEIVLYGFIIGKEKYKVSIGVNYNSFEVTD
ncbi:uncharacterized protein YdgA (DUF945 family) [Paenibacillus anaericanus]|uniref:hypothetical protein n=1 Tax=Paenibacillus anaericanus TaxID=170367 RepID=UPI002784B4F3|nr:hypothetical protein [Paenibacillus anaericanus]MDQ0091330.1 uncharacterized protein YdgA (DUF945 family) [Paenibacillus anaericanus]